MPAEDVEVAVELAHVDRTMRRGLGSVEENQGPGLMGHPNHLPGRVDRAQPVRDVGEGNQLGIRPQEHLVAVEAEPTLVVERHELQVGVLLLPQELPGHQVGVVLQLGQHDRVGTADVAPSPAVGHQVDRLSSVAHHDDLVSVGCVQEAPDPDPGLLVGGRRLLADRVDAAMHVRAVADVVVRHGLDDRPRLEAC